LPIVYLGRLFGPFGQSSVWLMSAMGGKLPLAHDHGSSENLASSNFPGLITTYPRASHAENPGSRIPPCARRTRLPPWHWLRRVRLSESASIANHKCNLRLARYRTGVPVGYPSIPQCDFQIRRSLSDYTSWRRRVLAESDGTFAFDDK